MPDVRSGDPDPSVRIGSTLSTGTLPCAGAHAAPRVWPRRAGQSCHSAWRENAIRNPRRLQGAKRGKVPRQRRHSWHCWQCGLC